MSTAFRELFTPETIYSNLRGSLLHAKRDLQKKVGLVWLGTGASRSSAVLNFWRNKVHKAIDGLERCYCFVDLPTAGEAEHAMAAIDGKPTPYGGLYRINVAYNQQDGKVCLERLGFGKFHVNVTKEVKRNLNSNWRSKI